MIIPASSVITCLVDFGISFFILIAMFIWFQFLPPIQILLLPFFIIIAFFSAFGIGLYLTAVNVKYRDFRYIIPFLVQFGLYVTPVGFCSSVIDNKYSFWFGLNPMVVVIDGFRWCLLGDPFQVLSFIQAIIITLLFLWLGVAYFRKMERTFADNI
jgi:lipopolysaccharide transport system permease protein